MPIAPSNTLKDITRLLKPADQHINERRREDLKSHLGLIYLYITLEAYCCGMVF